MAKGDTSHAVPVLEYRTVQGDAGQPLGRCVGVTRRHEQVAPPQLNNGSQTSKTSLDVAVDEVSGGDRGKDKKDQYRRKQNGPVQQKEEESVEKINVGAIRKGSLQERFKKDQSRSKENGVTEGERETGKCKRKRSWATHKEAEQISLCQ